MIQKKHLIELFERSVLMESNMNFRVHSFHNEIKLQYDICNSSEDGLGSVTIISVIDLEEQYNLLNDEFNPMQSINCRLIFRQRVSDATPYECDLTPKEFWDFAKMFKKAKSAYDTKKTKQADANSKIFLEEINDMFGLDFLPVERRILLEKNKRRVDDEDGDV